MNECLTNQIEITEQLMREIENTNKILKLYIERQLPIIPALTNLMEINNKSIIGYQRTSQTVTIGRKMTKSYAYRLILTSIFYSIVVGCACYIGSNYINLTNNLLIGAIGMTFMMLVIFVSYGCGFGLMKAYSIENNPTNFIEFTQDGINYVDAYNFVTRINYLIAVLKGKEMLVHKSYSEIEKVNTTKKIRYMKIPTSNLPISVDTTDYTFIFNDGKRYELINPVLLDRDKEIVEIIINEKINK